MQTHLFYELIPSNTVQNSLINRNLRNKVRRPQQGQLESGVGAQAVCSRSFLWEHSVSLAQLSVPKPRGPLTPDTAYQTPSMAPLELPSNSPAVNLQQNRKAMLKEHQPSKLHVENIHFCTLRLKSEMPCCQNSQMSLRPGENRGHRKCVKLSF